MSKGKVIVVEDDSLLRELVTGMFESAGYEVTPYGNVDAALHGCGFEVPKIGAVTGGDASRFPDLIVTDHSTQSDKNGMDLLAAFKNKGVGLVLMSTEFFDPARVKEVGGDAAEYVSKSKPDKILMKAEQSLAAVRQQKSSIVQSPTHDGKDISSGKDSVEIV